MTKYLILALALFSTEAKAGIAPASQPGGSSTFTDGSTITVGGFGTTGMAGFNNTATFYSSATFKGGAKFDSNQAVSFSSSVIYIDGSNPRLNIIPALTTAGRPPAALLTVGRETPYAVGFSSSVMYIQHGFGETTAGRYICDGWGFTDGNANPPAVMCYQQSANGGQTNGDFLFGAREITTDSEATEHVRFPTTGGAQFGSGAVVSSVTASGYLRLVGYTSAQLSPGGSAPAPAALGDTVRNSTINDTCISTGTSSGNWALAGSKGATGCF